MCSSCGDFGHNGAMTSAFDLRTAASGWFRLIALAEAVSWVGLLVGMYFKYLGSPRTEIGVKVFGMAHGLVFIAFVVAGLLVGMAFKWTLASNASNHVPSVHLTAIPTRRPATTKAMKTSP